MCVLFNILVLVDCFTVSILRAMQEHEHTMPTECQLLCAQVCGIELCGNLMESEFLPLNHLLNPQKFPLQPPNTTYSKLVCYLPCCTVVCDELAMHVSIFSHELHQCFDVEQVDGTGRHAVPLTFRAQCNQLLGSRR